MSNLSPEADNEEPVEAELAGTDLTPQQTYNVVTDTVTGVNLRMSDNAFQAIAIFVCLALGAGIGAVAFEQRVPAALVGGFIGLLTGLFGSGIFLMVYRAIRHLRGRHD